MKIYVEGFGACKEAEGRVEIVDALWANGFERISEVFKRTPTIESININFVDGSYKYTVDRSQ
jgi:hypothetical protein